MSSNRPDQKPVDAPPQDKPVEPQTPQPKGPPVRPRDGEDPPPDFGVPVGPGKGGGG